MAASVGIPQSVAELEAAVAAASDPAIPSAVRAAASAALNALRCGPDGGFEASVALLRTSDRDQSLFFALSTVQALLERDGRTEEGGRSELRGAITALIVRLETTHRIGAVVSGVPNYLRTKIGVVLALLVRADFPERWSGAFGDLATFLLQRPETAASGVSGAPTLREDLYLRSLHGLCDDVVDNPTSERDTFVKDALRGLPSGGGGAGVGGGTSVAPVVPANDTISAGLVEIAMDLIGRYRPVFAAAASATDISVAAESAGELCASAARLLSRLASWIDLSLVVNPTVLSSLYSWLNAAAGGEDPTPSSKLAVQAASTLYEIATRGMELEKKVALLTELNVFKNIWDSGLDLNTVDGTHIDVMIKVAELVNAGGMELLEARDATFSGGMDGGDDDESAALNALLHQMIQVFFACLAYDDIDVSGAVLPLASRLVTSLSREPYSAVALAPLSDGSARFRAAEHLPRILSVACRQMRYPPDFTFDPEDDDEAEEEVYRTDLRKLHRDIVRIRPAEAMAFLVAALSALPAPLSASPMPELEAALRLVHHHCEGVRPPPGMRTLMKDEQFRSILIGLHCSDISQHPHGEVLILYYDVSVRYHPLLKERPDLLERVLGALSGSGGLTHQSARVRSRSCYLLLKLVGAMGKALRPYAETAAGGIQSLLDDPNYGPLLSRDDRLYLFETTGVLLGRTGIDAADQRRYLTAVMTPHVNSILAVLRSSEMGTDPERCGEALSASVAAVSNLSKGFSRPPPEVSSVLAETVPIVLNVLSALPGDERVRSKCGAYLQRMIYCLKTDVLPSAPAFLSVLVQNCTVEDAVDAQAILQQLASRFRETAVPAIDGALLPFLRKCRSFATAVEEAAAGASASSASASASIGGGADDEVKSPAHLAAELLEIKKLSLGVLQQIVMHGAEAVFLTPANVSALPDVLAVVNDGAVNVEDPVVRRSSIQFFGGLVMIWGPDLRNVDPAVRVGFLRYIYDAFLPGLFASLLSSTFDIQDALSARIVSEVGVVLWAAREGRGANEFESEVIGRSLGPTGCPLAILDGFRAAGNGKDMAKWVGEMIGAARQVGR